jgi:hypothetical protein
MEVKLQETKFRTPGEFFFRVHGVPVHDGHSYHFPIGYLIPTSRYPHSQLFQHLEGRISTVANG